MVENTPARNKPQADAAAALCLYWPGSPEAVGSGIPEVKAYLNGIRVKNFNNWKLLVAKMAGSVLSIGSSMAVGMEGPLVMIGAFAGATLAHCGTSLSLLVLKIKGLKNRWEHGRKGSNAGLAAHVHSIEEESDPILHWLWVKATSDLSYFANDAERRKLITIGAACGFAASFGAPIGGMLFIMDDISTFFDQGMFLRILVANSVGTFCLAYYRGNLSDYGAISFGSYNGEDDNSIRQRFFEIPFWIIMGIGGGILGGGFCKAFGDVKRRSAKQFKTKGMKMLRVSYISLINSVVMFLLPTMGWVCHDLPTAAAEQQFFCQEGETNQMASIFFGSRGKAIVRILSDPDQFYASTLAIVGSVFFVLMLYTNTTSIPSGLFTPIVISGASFGGAYGVFLKEYVDNNIDASSFALMGVGSIMAGIQRSTVSTCVILVEGTGQMRILLPVMIVVVISNYVAHLIHEDGIYEVLMKRKGYPYLSHDKDDRYDVFSVGDIMSSSPVTLREKEQAVRLVEILRKTTHNGFPVVDENGVFKGLVRRKQIVALIEFGIFEEDGPARGDTTKPKGNSKGLMNFAYVIKDDRFEDVTEEVDDEEQNKSSKWKLVKAALKMTSALKSSNRKRRLADDLTMPIVDVSLLDNCDLLHETDSDAGIDGGGDDIESDDEDGSQAEAKVDAKDKDESADGYLGTANRGSISITSESAAEDSIYFSSSMRAAPMMGHARVGRNRRTNVLVISWLNPDNKYDVVDLASVMNRGAFSVPVDFPVSKAYDLFTLLGLRWIVVLGGPHGGSVVGILTRESFLRFGNSISAA
ncbi:unnamed protein product [Pseudo-nitzschia multistriata]|uniref:Chloride channel protein n=1 Tax=Pseudo-nitzschia multistriata TaxID=183589 RepID=A0A448ZKU3_9STRA|nr:unnamed protein product [Pseudo-nitzschia multistriata]